MCFQNGVRSLVTRIKFIQLSSAYIHLLGHFAKVSHCYCSWSQGTTCKRVFLMLMQDVNATFLMKKKVCVVGEWNMKRQSWQREERGETHSETSQTCWFMWPMQLRHTDVLWPACASMWWCALNKLSLHWDTGMVARTHQSLPCLVVWLWAWPRATCEDRADKPWSSEECRPAPHSLHRLLAVGKMKLLFFSCSFFFQVVS